MGSLMQMRRQLASKMGLLYCGGIWGLQGDLLKLISGEMSFIGAQGLFFVPPKVVLWITKSAFFSSEEQMLVLWMACVETLDIS